MVEQTYTLTKIFNTKKNINEDKSIIKIINDPNQKEQIYALLYLEKWEPVVQKDEIAFQVLKYLEGKKKNGGEVALAVAMKDK